MRKLRPIAIAAFCSIGFGAFAADYRPQLFAPPPLDPAPKPVELGTGWYLRGDASWGQGILPLLNSDGSFTNSSKRNDTYVFGLGAGYKFNNWFRADLTFDASTIQTRTNSTTKLADGVTNIICPSSLQALTNPTTGSNVGYLWSESSGTCRETQQTSLRTLALLLNGYVDLGTWTGVTPYVGAGAGMMRIQTNASTRFNNTADGSLYSPSSWTQTASTPAVFLNEFGTYLSPQPTIPNTTTPVSLGTTPSWNTNVRNIRYNFAWALMAGVAIDLAPHAKLDVGYRYMNASDKNLKVQTQEVRVGLRYTPD